MSSSAMEIVMLVTAGAQPGARDLCVKNASPWGGKALVRDAFTVHNPSPFAESIAPASGRPGSAMRLKLKGRGFLQGVTALVVGDGIVVDTLSVKNSSEMEVCITIQSATHAGPRCISVSNPGPGGGTATLTDGFSVLTPNISRAESDGAVSPDHPALVGVYPNPFNHAVTVLYGLPDRCMARLVVRNILGVVIAEVLNGVQPAGYHSVRWESTGMPSGIYFVQLIVESDKLSRRFTTSRKLILLK